MATLNGGIGATDELIRITGTPPAPGTYFTIDSEAFLANGAARGADGRSFTRDWLAVDRGVAGTTKATHSNGATLTVYYPDAKATGGGAISATDGTTTVDPATSIQVPPGLLSSPGGGVAAVTPNIHGSDDPSTGAGVAADLGTIFVNDSNGFLYAKIGALDTDWGRIVVTYASGVITDIGATDGTTILLANSAASGGTLDLTVAPGKGVLMFDGTTAVLVLFGAVDPSAGAGVEAPVGSTYQRNNGAGLGQLWVKTGAADTAWTNVTP